MMSAVQGQDFCQQAQLIWNRREYISDVSSPSESAFLRSLTG